VNGFIDAGCKGCIYYRKCFPEMKDVATGRLLEFMKAMVRRDYCVYNDKCNYKGKG